MAELENLKLSDSEYRLMDILWDNEDMEATLLVSICLEKYGWKKPTVYTMLKRLGEKGALRFENRIVSALVCKNQVDKSESEALLNKAYKGSISSFLSAFLQDKKLTKEDADRLKKMIEEASE